MKDWVVPLLRSLRPEFVSERCYEEELAQPVFVWRRIANLLIHDFASDSMVELLGSILSDLPKDAFLKILEMCPFFILAKSAGFCQMIHSDRPDIPLVIFSQGELMPMNLSERRGCIGHELAHLSLGHLSRSFSLDDPYRDRQEREADDLVREWGLQNEIDAVRAYLKKQKGGNENGFF